MAAATAGADPAIKQDAPQPGLVVANETEEKRESVLDLAVQSWTWRIYVPLGVFFCLVGIAGFVMYSSWAHFVDSLFQAVEASEHKVAQALVINGVLVLLIVGCLPGPAFCVMLDGFFFGFLKGFVLGFIGELIGYLTCIFLARSCFKARMRQWIAEHAKLNEVLKVLEEDSTGKFLVLFRFISLPVWLKNYAMGMLDVTYLKLILVFIPGEIFYAGIFSYIGSKGHEIATAMRKGNTQKALDSFSGFEVMIFSASVIGLLGMIILGWREYLIRRSAITEGAHTESAPLVGAKKCNV